MLTTSTSDLMVKSFDVKECPPFAVASLFYTIYSSLLLFIQNISAILIGLNPPANSS